MELFRSCLLLGIGPSHNQDLDGISFLIGDHLKYSQTKEESDMSGDRQTYGKRIFMCQSFLLLLD